MKFEKEEELRPPVKSWLHSFDLDVYDEILFAGRIPDLMAVEGKKIEKIVELKLTDYKSALAQAYIWIGGKAKETYVAMPESKIHLPLDHEYKGENQFEKYGVGLLSVSKDGTIEVELEPEEKEVDEFYHLDGYEEFHQRDVNTNEIKEVQILDNEDYSTSETSNQKGVN